MLQDLSVCPSYCLIESSYDAPSCVIPVRLPLQRSFGSFMRRFRLPEAVDVEGEFWSGQGVCVLEWPGAALRLGLCPAAQSGASD